MIRVHCFGFTFTPKAIPTLGLILVLPILLKLGFWQLGRADFKAKLQTQFASRPNHAPLGVAALKETDRSYYPIRLSGRYDNEHQFLLDNQIRQRRPGYEIYTPFRVDATREVVLVNRGWIPRGADRQHLPLIAPVVSHQTIQGLLKKPPSKTFVLTHKDAAAQWPRRIQAIDLKKMASWYGHAFQPMMVLLSPDQPSGYVREWRPKFVGPNKHLGYAFQWFALSVTLVIIYLLLNTSRSNHAETREKAS